MKRWLVASCVLAACSGSAPPSDEGCEGPLGKPLSASGISALDACCQAQAGAAHCLGSDKVPSEIQPFVETCASGGYCIPDSFLATGASEPPATCTAFGGPGVCLSKCIPQVAENQTALRPETCTGADELCVPCTNPIDGTDTHACDLLQLATCVGEEPPPPSATCDDPATCNYEAGCPPVIDATALGLAACGADAHCLDAALITDPAQASRLAKCDDATKLCVPDVFLATGGKFTPATCTSVNGAEGRCLSTVLPDVAAQATLLPQDTCAASERCTPCFDPLDGASTGACNLSCDAGPTQPAKPFAQCCDARARCVPTTSIPDDQEGNLSEQECADAQPGSLCVPNEIITNGPFPTCNASAFPIGNYTGVCLSDCLDFGIQGLVIARGSCDSGFKCAPCETFGQPTGAPGCPP